MNIEQANAIPMSEIMSKLEFQVVKEKNGELWYKSPFRNEKTASFAVNVAKNAWFDHGEGKKNGGYPFHFVTEWLSFSGETNTPVDVLRWFRNMFGQNYIPQGVKEERKENGQTLKLQEITEINNKGLIDYLSNRGISLAVANKYLKQASILNNATGRIFQTLALSNENDGHELRNKFFKGCIGKKSISFIRSEAKKTAKQIHLFEGVFDFLTAVEQQKNKMLSGDIIILNSLSCLNEAIGYVRTNPYSNIISWLDNDDAGDKATKLITEFATENKMKHIQKNKIYAGYKDINAWHMDKIKPDQYEEAQEMPHDMDFTAKVTEVELVYHNKLKPHQRPRVKSSIDAYELFIESWDENKIELQEQFRIMLLNNQNHVLGVSTLATGTVSQCVVDLKLAFATALKANATSMILSHNHPSGSMTFSDADEKLTGKFCKAAQYLDIKILDHILVTAYGYQSMADIGRMPIPF